MIFFNFTFEQCNFVNHNSAKMTHIFMLIIFTTPSKKITQFELRINVGFHFIAFNTVHEECKTFVLLVIPNGNGMPPV